MINIYLDETDSHYIVGDSDTHHAGLWLPQLAEAISTFFESDEPDHTHTMFKSNYTYRLLYSFPSTTSYLDLQSTYPELFI